MTGDQPAPRMRPFFPSVQDFAAATTPHFPFLVDQHGFVGPSIEEQDDESYDVTYYGLKTAVLLSWDTTGGFFGCNLAPRRPDGSLDPDYRLWLSVNEIVAASGAPERWVGQAELDDVDLDGYAKVMSRVADNLRTYCGAVLTGDWSIREAADRWLEETRDI